MSLFHWFDDQRLCGAMRRRFSLFLVAATGVGILGACAGVHRPNPVTHMPAALTDTYWRLVAFEDQPIDIRPGQREPHMVLSTADGQQRASARFGCNQILGIYAIDGDALRLTWSASTRMACLPPLDAREVRLTASLSGPLRWRIADGQLYLSRQDGAPVASFTAVALR